MYTTVKRKVLPLFLTKVFDNCLGFFASLRTTILFIIIIASPAYSQRTASDTVSTEEIVVTANRIKTTALRSPNKVQILSKEFILSTNGCKLSEALGYADAIFIKDYGFNSGLKTISLNATQSEHTLILLDGIKLNSRQNSQFDIGLIQLDDISRIEISKGGISSLYGAEAIGGVLNIISDRKPYLKDRDLGFELKAASGSYSFKKIFLKMSQHIKKFNYNLSYSFETSKNNYNYFLHRNFETIEKQRINSEYYTDAFKLTGSLSLRSNSSLEYLAYYNYWNRNLPGIELGYASSFSKQIDRDLIASLSYKKIISSTKEYRAGIDYKYSLMNYYDPITFSQQNPINSFYKLNTIINNAEYKAALSDLIYFDAGYEVSYSNIISNEVDFGKTFQTGIFTALKINIKDKFTFYPSIRHDYYSDINKSIVTGKLGVNIKPFSNVSLAIKSSIGNNFREPTFNELFWKNLGNKNLLPEKSMSFDAGIYYDFKLLSQNTFEISYFNINTTDRIIWQPDNSGVWHPLNVGKVTSQGIDISLHLLNNFSDNLNAAAFLNYNFGKSLKKNKDFESDNTYLKQLIYLPQEYFKSSFMMNYLTTSKVIKSVSLNAFYTFYGKRFSDPENTRFLGYYELIDANISLNLSLLKTDLSCKFAINNLTNSDYQIISGYPMPLRNYRFEIGFKY